MASTLSHKSITEICLFNRSYYTACPLNREWRFIADHCAVPDSYDSSRRPPAEYFSSDGFRITVGKHTLTESLDMVFSPGEPILLWKSVPQGLIEGILERYQTECKTSLVMRTVTMTGVNITDVWINAYYTSFPCRQCSSRVGAMNKLVFHLTPPAAHKCLSLKYCSYWAGIPDFPERHQQVEVVNWRHDGSLLRFADLRREAWRFLPRSALDTCLLVNRLWNAEVNELGTQLSLRALRWLTFTYDPVMQRLCFNVIDADSEFGSNRTFMLSRNAAVDSAIAVNHLRNCVATSELVVSVRGYYEDGKDEDNIDFDHSVGPWISELLGSVKNFRFDELCLYLEKVNAADAVHFLFATRHALDSRINDNGLRCISLMFDYGALEDLVEEHFLQWAYMQNLVNIVLTICPRGPDPPGEPTWVHGLFQLPKCKKLTMNFLPRGDSAPDCAEHTFIVLREIVKLFENAGDVSGFPGNFEFVLKQDERIWVHQEPTPTYSNVPVPLLHGLWNVYVTKNRSTGVPLSVFVGTKANGGAFANPFCTSVRRFIFRQELYSPELARTPSPRKRCLQE